MKEKKLGKIVAIAFGLCGYNDAMLGLKITFEGPGWGASALVCFWDYTLIEHTERCKWTEESRNKDASDLCRRISQLLNDSGKNSISQLRGVPAEVEFIDGNLSDWRILKEVL